MSLAGIGPDQTRVRILAVPGLARNCHDIEVEGEFGRLHVHIENIPSENPKTGKLTALSIIRAVQDAVDTGADRKLKDRGWRIEDRRSPSSILRSSILDEKHAPTSIMNNSDVIVRTLQEAGVRWVFGVPSGPVLPLIEALRQSSIEFVLTASETSAAFMATAVGYLTGVPGVCVSTVGPGATNLTTGVGCAWLDRAPVVAITCNVATPWLERRIQMRIDHHALFKPLTKATLSLRGNSVCATVEQAIAIACEEPPGPVHLDLPEDISLSIQSDFTAASVQENGLPDLSREIVRTLSGALAQLAPPLVDHGVEFHAQPSGG